jgi:hypothetical protein
MPLVCYWLDLAETHHNWTRETFALSTGASKKSLFIQPNKTSQTGCRSPIVRFALA